MKKALIYYFIFSLVAGTSIYVLQKLSVSLPSIINNYVNDFLIIPIILTPSLYLLRWTRNNKNYVLPLSIILYLCALYSIFFEWYLPQVLERYTTDIIDVFLYFTGGIVFYALQKHAT
jgi:hypothetical protein